LKIVGGLFDLDSKLQKLEDLEKEICDPDFWNDKENAQKVNNELSKNKRISKPWVELKEEISEFSEMLELAYEENDESLLAELQQQYEKINKIFEKLDFQSTLNGETDSNNAYLTINAGAGGTESCDWASMLARMYMRYAEENGFEYYTVDYIDGDEAGYKSVLLHIKGDYAFGYLKGERGVHRLVRVSPFDSNKRRHTSFAAIDVIPEIEDDIQIEINTNDLRVDTYRSSGAGGQHVNKTDSAVRLTHIPTGIVVQCQNERSQHKNRDQAMKLLKAKLHSHYEDQKQEERAKVEAEKKDIAWGSQIRSYVLFPYTLVKDLRTGHETGNSDAVLDGQLQPFIDAYLKWHRNN
jgi:peptide chain release factor 2